MNKDLRPEVSVIIPTYNRANLLPRALNSVLYQSFTDFEIIIVNDGSTDATNKVIEEYDDPRIHYYSLEHIGNISSVRNIGLDKSNGNYIAFIDSDDIWHKDKLKTQLKILKQNEGSFLLTDYIVCESGEVNIAVESLSDIELSPKEASSIDAFQLLISNKLVFYPSTLIFPSIFLQTIDGLDESVSVSEMEFVGRMSYHFSPLFLAEKTTIIVKHDSNISNQDFKKNFDEKYLLLNNLLNKNIISNQQYNKSKLEHHLSFMVIPGLEKNVLKSMIKESWSLCAGLKDYWKLLKVIVKTTLSIRIR